jgi:hypothetical protein
MSKSRPLPFYDEKAKLIAKLNPFVWVLTLRKEKADE